MKKLLYILAACVTSAGAAIAQPRTLGDTYSPEPESTYLPTNPYAAIEDSELAAVIRETGTTIQFDAKDCNTQGLLGYYQLTIDSDGEIDRDVMTLCVKQHGSNYAELEDTFRHEAVHVAQACNGMNAINRWQDLSELISESDYRLIVRNYDRGDYHLEMEAYVLAERMSNDQVAEFVSDNCFE